MSRLLNQVFSFVGILTGFLQVRGNWKKAGNLSGQGNLREKYVFGEVRENEKLVPPDVRFSG